MEDIIRALSSAQSELCESIEDILKYLDDVLYPIVSPEHWNVYSELHDMISSLLFAQPKMGKWILSDLQSIEEMENGNYYYFCSNCLHEDVHGKTQKVPYCWYCGAKMESEDDENME